MGLVEDYLSTYRLRTDALTGYLQRLFPGRVIRITVRCISYRSSFVSSRRIVNKLLVRLDTMCYDVARQSVAKVRSNNELINTFAAFCGWEVSLQVQDPAKVDRGERKTRREALDSCAYVSLIGRENRN